MRAPGEPSALSRNFGTMNSVVPLMPGGRALDAREHEMHDVFGQVVLAGRDEDLGAGDLVAAVACLTALVRKHAEIGAAMRLGQVHRAGPAALDHLRQIGRLLLRRAVARGSPRSRPASGPDTWRNAMLAEAHHLVDDHWSAVSGRPWPPNSVRRRDAHPAALGVLPVGVLEALRRGHAAVVVPGAAFPVARQVERLHHLLAELGGFAQESARSDPARRRRSPADCCSAQIWNTSFSRNSTSSTGAL